ncbi:unnamed protein product [Adineta ricciae]|uniref:VCBS repeat-containing protein n=1 Tax=Adineta ricciae TaxID=249248 RepID=A0A815MSZ3_ADIRI|nr:unnamed protein product [Adineta ricciae]CAF1427180.1 unnamed protein product [Adineta ricciae]
MCWAVSDDQEYNSPSFVRVGDVNNGGKFDLVITYSNHNNFGILFNNAANQFLTQISYDTDKEPISALIADLNYDKKLDILIVNRKSHSIGIYFNNSHKPEFPSVTYSTQIESDFCWRRSCQ